MTKTMANFQPQKSEMQLPLSIWLLASLLLVAFAVWGSPFLIDFLNSGDQLPPTLQLVDPQLFRGDAVVEAIGRLKSGFYLALAASIRRFGVAPQQIESVLYVLFVASRILLIAGIAAICRSLKNSFWLFVIFAAWCCHQKPSLLGSVTFFMPMLTHNEVAMVIGLFAIACWLRGRIILFWLLGGVMVLVHVLVGLQFIMCFAPAWLWRRKLDKRFLIGAGLFGLCCVIYLLTMLPPPMSADEWRLFVSGNGDTGHISLLKLSWLEWVNAVSFFGLSWVAFNRFLKGDAGFELLKRAMICGTVFGLILSLTATVTRAMKPMLFQPLRIFFWVTLICFLFLVAAMIEAFKSSRLAGILLAAPLVLTVLNSILAPMFAVLGLGYFAAEWLAKRFGVPIQRFPQIAAQTCLVLSVAGIFAAWALGNKQPVGSLSSPVLLLPGAICLAVLFVPGLKNWNPKLHVPIVAALIIYSLIAISLHRYTHSQRWLDADWRTVRLWVQANTNPSDRFITPPDQVGFRVLALRSTVSESLPRVIWSAPYTYLENKQAAERAAKGYDKAATDPEYLFGLAHEWNCNYVITRGNYDNLRFKPVFSSGKFSVLKVTE